MDMISPTYRLESEHELSHMKLGRLMGQWRVDDDAGLVTYVPAGIVFAIDYDGPAEADHIEPMHLSACAVHLCDGKLLPPPAKLRPLALQAIHAFALLAEVGNGAAANDNDDRIPF